MNEKLLFEIAERYGFKVEKTEPGKGGFVLGADGIIETEIIGQIVMSFFGANNTFMETLQYDKFDINYVCYYAA